MNVGWRWLGLLILWLAMSAASPAQEKKNIELARTTPLSDVHMHLHGGHDAQHYRRLMDRANVRWGGAVGGGRRGRGGPGGAGGPARKAN